MSLQLKSLLVVVQNLNLEDLTALKQEVDKQQEHKKLEWVYSLIPSITSVFDVEIRRGLSKTKTVIIITLDDVFNINYSMYCHFYGYRLWKPLMFQQPNYQFHWSTYETIKQRTDRLLTCGIGVEMGITIDMIKELEYVLTFLNREN